MTDTLQEPLAGLDRSGDEIAKLTSRLVRIPTVNPPGETVDLVQAIDEYLRGKGIETAVHEPVSGKASLCATVHGRGQGKLLWLGHIDVVPPGQTDAWERGPFSGDVADGRIFGRGTTDTKGGDAAAMVVASLLQRMGDKLGPTVEFWFTCDEEVGGTDGARWLAGAGLFRGHACIIGDGWSGPTPSLDIGCKGGMATTLRAKGTAGHASRPFLADNAIDKLLAVIPFAKRIADYRLDLPEELSDVLRQSGEDLIESSNLSGQKAEDARHSFLYPTVNLSVVSGGVKTNVVPDEATATFDIRLTPGSDREKVRQRLLELVAEAGVEGVTAEIRPAALGGASPATAGYYESPGDPFVQYMRSTVRLVTGVEPRLKILTGGTDGFSTHHVSGIPSVGFGAGLPGLAHGPNEYVTLANLVRAAKVYAAAALGFKPAHPGVRIAGLSTDV